MSLRLSRRTLFASGGAAALAAGPVFAQTTAQSAPANDDASLAAAVVDLTWLAVAKLVALFTKLDIR